MASSKKKSRLLLFTLLASLLLHILLMILPLHLLRAPPKDSEEPMLVQRITLPEDQGQIVDQFPDANKERPDTAKFLSEFNNRADKETRAPLIGDPHQTPPPSKPRPEPKQPTAEPKPKSSTTLALEEKAEEKRTQEKPKPSWEDLTTITPKEERPSQLSRSDDHLPETEVGDKTLLNTKEFVFYSYYARIKERLRMIWAPSLRPVLARLYYSGVEFDQGDLVTKVRVVLTRDGSLQSIRVLEGSGNREIDQVAVNSFEKAAPFPNPPSGMIEKDGNVYLRWDFILTTTGGPLLKVFISRQ